MNDIRKSQFIGQLHYCCNLNGLFFTNSSFSIRFAMVQKSKAALFVGIHSISKQCRIISIVGDRLKGNVNARQSCLVTGADIAYFLAKQRNKCEMFVSVPL
ncbi:unnamed protein product [Ixodes pacificus]